MYNKRLIKLQQGLNKAQIDAILVSTPANIAYLTPFIPTSETEREAWLLVTTDVSFFFTDARYYEKVRRLKLKVESLHTKLIDSEHKLLDQLPDILERNGTKKLAFEQEDLRYLEWDKMSKALNKIELVEIRSPVFDLRIIKDIEEIKILKKACKLTDEILKKLVPFIKPGVSEQELAWMLEKMTREQGHQVSFPPIVAVDANSAIPHHNSQVDGKSKIKVNSIVLIDFGVRYRSYCADMTRMFFVGNPNKKALAMYQTLLKIQKQTILQAQNKTRVADLDSFCSKIMIDNKLPSLPHSLGHGVGLDIHEKPHISDRSEEVLTPGMVVTIEPGVYLPGEFGIRIEDTVLITDGNPEILTKFKK